MRIDTLSGLCALIISTSVLAITPGQVDTFGDGTTQGWFVPGLSATPPVNILTGGPAGEPSSSPSHPPTSFPAGSEPCPARWPTSTR